MRNILFTAFAIFTMAIGIATSASAMAKNVTKTYTPGLVQQELDAGNTVFVIYGTSWCVTCLRQERVIDKLRAENPEYNEKMTFVYVDWNKYKSAEISQWYNVPRRSTLLVLRGEKELGRSVAGTGRSTIKKLLDAAL